MAVLTRVIGGGYTVAESWEAAAAMIAAASRTSGNARPASESGVKGVSIVGKSSPLLVRVASIFLMES